MELMGQSERRDHIELTPDGYRTASYADATSVGQGERSLPAVVGLCSDPRCADEFYMPDPKPGDSCPYCDRKLVHYKRTTYRVDPPSRGQSD